ncbi:Outer membrane protein TolC [Chitinophaga costaii]|uniref:Outer membrane protein TolC n=1 Tax=Chitinophaga costaii TaxID=1335309 RepID=A0A1C3YP46_9BACT|nr:TolC family protein [Chitinophaga costaii]PUZ30030.1 TolC family protein [Chitinophaga costaii]SCB71831.1 Outer membrane protein TolC [Chitinophaga costaii]
MLIRTIYFCGCLLISQFLRAQSTDTLTLTLQQVVSMAKDKSIAARQAVTTQKTKYWQYRTYLSNYQPQLALNGTLPGYNKTFTQVQQPDGTILFQSVHNNNSTLDLSFSQTISATGATVFGTTQLQRYDDFDRKTTLYNSTPLGIGYSQPLWQFNALKWDKKIEPLKYRESKQEFIESMEQIAITANGYFFDLLLAQVNLQIAETNLTNTLKILDIAHEKFSLGKISKNEILQLQLELLKSKKAVGIARRDMEIATLNLSSYTGLQGQEKISLLLPTNIVQMQAPPDKVLSEAYANRSDAIAFVRRMAEARRDIAKARGDNGLNAALTAQLGYSKSAATIPTVYQHPQDQQEVQLTFSIPILDWGRSKSRTKTAEANLEFTAYAVEQAKQTFTQQIVTQVTLFDMMKDQLVLTAGADSIASEKYQIAKDRYVLGNLSITDLSIAFQEKDQAKRDYIAALRDFWGAYYQLRYLSLYDFEKNEKITYRQTTVLN